MDLLRCVCGIAFEDDDTERLYEDPFQIQCARCLALTPPCTAQDQAVAAWNAMQKAMRQVAGAPVETMTVEIPVVVSMRGGERWVSVPWFDPRPGPMSDPVASVARAGMANTLLAGAKHSAAYVISTTLPVPQPPQVVEGSAEAVGIGCWEAGQSVTHLDEDGEPVTWTGPIRDGGE